jgi:hypothetical protein
MPQCEVGLKLFRDLDPMFTERCTHDADHVLHVRHEWGTMRPDERILLCDMHIQHVPHEIVQISEHTEQTT